ncbi:MAG TPA: ScyD/ScyE family protein [Marmoricola sp.]|jgi:hypothetical protein
MTILNRHRSALAVATTGVLAAAGLAASPVAVAQGGAAHRHAPAARMTVVARGLNNPRLLTMSGHALYVAEAGRGGGKKHCIPTDEGKKCVGMTGSITWLRGGKQRRVVRHLPSLAAPDHTAALGPADVLVRSGHVVISMGAGIDKHQRRMLGTGGRMLGTIIRTSLANPGHRGMMADVVQFEWKHNPDHSKAHDSDPTGIAPTRHAIMLTDSGGNDLLRIHRTGGTRTVAVFPDRMVSNPLPGPAMVPMQAVPTAVARARHAWFVSQLTGFPFPVGASNIYRLRPGHKPQVWARGLTNVTDIAWHKGRLYAVQIADSGLLPVFTQGKPAIGSLIRVHRGDNSSPHVVAGGLTAPYGVALRGSSAYVTTCSVCPGGGQVVRVPIR